jgi:hypothetical protein
VTWLPYSFWKEQALKSADLTDDFDTFALARSSIISRGPSFLRILQDSQAVQRPSLPGATFADTCTA